MKARKPPASSGKSSHRQEPAKNLQGIAHVVKTGLPPGISPGDAKDPGANTPKTQRRKTDNRS
jgi:hypothetical protein